MLNNLFKGKPGEVSGKDSKRIAVLGTLDSKGEEHAYVASVISSLGHEPVLIDVGSYADPTVEPQYTRFDVAAAAGKDLTALYAKQDRGECVVAISEAVPIFVKQLQEEGKIDGIISLGGGGGTAIGCAAMRALPVGFPKVMVSTLASGNTAHYIETKDIVMVPSVVDVAGLNRISKEIFSRAAGAICGMVEVQVKDGGESKPLIVASMFGNTTDCINKATEVLEDAGYEVLVFHATGTGGKAMESLIETGMVDGVLDLTTTEWADEVTGATLSAGPTRMDAMTKAQVPCVVAPGCLDMANFGARETVPAEFEGRNFYIHNPQVTLMRTNAEECTKLGEVIAAKANANVSRTKVMIPLKGISVVAQEGQPFYDPAADEALFSAIKSNFTGETLELDCDINNEQFAVTAAKELINLINKQ